MRIGKCCQVMMAGERVFTDDAECVQGNEGCMDRVLKNFFSLLSKLIIILF